MKQKFSIIFALVVGSIVLLSLNQVYGLTFEDIKNAGQRAKERVKLVQEAYGPVQHQPEVLSKRDIYNQTYYDCFNYGVAFELELFGGPNSKFEDQAIDECHFFYNETGIWMGLKAIENVNFSEPKFVIADKKLSDIKQQDQILEQNIREHRNDTILDKLKGFFFK
jgi:hypothetical protein